MVLAFVFGVAFFLVVVRVCGGGGWVLILGRWVRSGG